MHVYIFVIKINITLFEKGYRKYHRQQETSKILYAMPINITSKISQNTVILEVFSI